VLKYAKGRLHENLIVVALGTGMRAGEALGLTEDDLDFKKRESRINKTLVYLKDLSTGKYVFKYQSPKTESGKRVIPIQESVYKALKRQLIQKKEIFFCISVGIELYRKSDQQGSEEKGRGRKDRVYTDGAHLSPCTPAYICYKVF